MSKYAEVIDGEFHPDLPVVEFTYAEVAEMVVIVDAVSELLESLPEFSDISTKCKDVVTMGDVNFSIVRSGNNT